VGATLLVETLARLSSGAVPEEHQDEALVTYAHRLERSDSEVDWVRPAPAIHDQIRGLQPWPLAAVRLQGRRLLLLRSAVVSDVEAPAPPGTIVDVQPDALVVAAVRGLVRLLVVQPEGRPPMAVRDFLNGRKVTAGERLEPVLATP
jgi:methionyl-tRNA formyltransferase